ncbi:hypothetical protein RWV98_13440 [Agathobaculum sp. NTUH-O15-33]|uniref:hypothetical protein n=1 Tax=Agathobaculum sp. NTUH-O15-33 TaxID=3079302 RepID=UPI0029586B61|nr:hypothetical protein [Agathobaculum sp. NTUH-O15-33]WNX83596.1 hypothetical protein RWV98_13440 [Agathobaculum sp. NTUH-O15-33]
MITDECLNKWCVYYESEKCRLPGITVNVFGMCESCVMLEPDEVIAAPLRRETVRHFDEMDSAIEKRIKNDRPIE